MRGPGFQILVVLSYENFGNWPLPSIPCPFFVGWVNRQCDPTLMLGLVPQPNLQIKTFWIWTRY
ncbi:MAG: hypothetical protein AN481_00590 [Aphanizomenon flos-aquae LD13]|uniref:Uncharacterized protein n=1 Tax=Aphanizomenon flos-aquae LD13 TaxID=1710894 RepID=A0A1B7W2G1_APHFL|nr:MAG: hypothetical protein AN481_00590 [Aphanizomenon flos-aquae LD13]HCQ22899.1 hypothetical protein [Anabaena sp. UBA12330]